MVVHREDLCRETLIVETLRLVDDQVHHATGLFVGEVFFHQRGPPAGVDQVIKTNPGNAFPFQKFEDIGDILRVPLINCEPKTHLDPLVHAVVDTSQSGIKSPHDTAELVVGLSHPIQAYSYIRQANILEFSRHLLGNKRPVRGDNRTHSPFPRVIRQLV